VYLSSALHRDGDASLKDLTWAHRPWSGRQAYSDTKFHDVLLAFCHCETVAVCAFKRAGAWLGAHQDGRFKCAGRSRPSASHSDVACREQ
jgi:hypothetical protein